MTKKAADGERDYLPGFDRLDALLKRTLTASNKDVRAKMEAEKKARKRKRR